MQGDLRQHERDVQKRHLHERSLQQNLHEQDLLDDAIAGTLRYANMSGKQFEQSRAAILAHLFNHETHHRGQAHAILSICTGREPPSLDLLSMQRGSPAPDLRGLARR